MIREAAMKEGQVSGPAIKETLRLLLEEIDVCTLTGPELSKDDITIEGGLGSSSVLRNYISRIRKFLQVQDAGEIITITRGSHVSYQFRCTISQWSNAQALKQLLGMDIHWDDYEEGDLIMVDLPGASSGLGQIKERHPEGFAVRMIDDLVVHPSRLSEALKDWENEDGREDY